MSVEDVLQKLLSKKIEKKTPDLRRPGKPGRPKVAREKKAKNLTLCLAPQFVEFIDKMKVRDPKVKGRGRKVRFIIERFVEHERRSITHMKVLHEALSEVQDVLSGFGSQVKKGEKLNLSLKDKQKITGVVNQVHALMRILGYQPNQLKKMLGSDDWSLLAFCMDWKSNRELVF